MNPANHATSLSDHLAFSAVIVYGIQYLKTSPRFKWLTVDTEKLNRRVALVMSFFGALGVSFAIEGNFQSGGHILVAFPPIDQMFDLARHWAAQFVLNQILYKTAVAPAGK